LQLFIFIQHGLVPSFGANFYIKQIYETLCLTWNPFPAIWS
jgi:hypothetical protein